MIEYVYFQNQMRLYLEVAWLFKNAHVWKDLYIIRQFEDLFRLKNERDLKSLIEKNPILLLYNPIFKLSELYEKKITEDQFNLNKNEIEAIKNYSDKVWYAINCRTDVNERVFEWTIAEDERLLKRCNKLFELSLKKMDKSAVAEIAGIVNAEIVPSFLLIISNKDHKKNENINMKPNVFIVHGHDDALLAKVSLFIERLGFNAIVLREQVSLGKTIIEKIKKYTDVAYGIVLYTPCDIGCKNGEINLRGRARQNVVFEHGYLMAKLGEEKVCALVMEDVETPGDLSGVVYIPYDERGKWQYEIANEMKGAGLMVDLNAIK